LEFRLDIWCHGWNLSFPREGQSLCLIGKTESQTVYRTNKQTVIWLQILYTGNTCILENQWHFILQSIVFTNEIGFYTVSQNIYSYFNGRHYTLLSTLKGGISPFCACARRLFMFWYITHVITWSIGILQQYFIKHGDWNERNFI
jgi:hypothetical protein